MSHKINYILFIFFKLYLVSNISEPLLKKELNMVVFPTVESPNYLILIDFDIKVKFLEVKGTFPATKSVFSLLFLVSSI